MSLKEKLENNRKILKRFQFELESGIFKGNISNDVYYFTPFVDCDVKSKRFIKILRKLKYRYGGFEASFYTYGITLKPNKKEYFFYAVNRGYFARNEIPNYVMDYIEHPILDAIKETIHYVFKRKARK